MMKGTGMHRKPLIADPPRLTYKRLLEYIKEQYFASYEGEWEDMVREAHAWLLTRQRAGDE